MQKTVCWIDHVSYENANPGLREIYDQVLSPSGQLDNLYRGFSLTPQTILPADDLYKATLHHDSNLLPKAFAELLGTYVAILAGCDYAKAHHGQNFTALSPDTAQADLILVALASDNIDACGDELQVRALSYVRKLCLQPSEMAQTDIEDLRRVGWTDAEISEIVQVVAMFSYFVRVINGVGIGLGDEKLGLY